MDEHGGSNKKDAALSVQIWLPTGPVLCCIADKPPYLFEAARVPLPAGPPEHSGSDDQFDPALRCWAVT